MAFHQADQEIIGAVIVQFFAAGCVFADLADDLLMVLKQRFDEVSRAVQRAGHFLQPRLGQHLLHGAWGGIGQGADAFGDLVNELLQFAILLLKEQVHGVKVAADHIPVGVACFGIEYMFITQKLAEDGGHFFTIFVRDTDVGFHKQEQV